MMTSIAGGLNTGIWLCAVVLGAHIIVKLIHRADVSAHLLQNVTGLALQRCV